MKYEVINAKPSQETDNNRDGDTKSKIQDNGTLFIQSQCNIWRDYSVLLCSAVLGIEY